MVKKFFAKGRSFLTGPQESVLIAATIIMFMVVASRILGLIRQRVLAHFFTTSELSLFFAAFRLPDLVFEVLVFGTFASAFIPVFAKSLKEGKEGEKKAWETAGIVVNIGLLVFLTISIVLGSGAHIIYSFLAPGFSDYGTRRIAEMTRILFAAQGFFVVSYVLTAVLESLRMFLIPALAPLLYNIGIILGTVLLSPRLGLMGPVVGVVFGASIHFLIQLPLALKLGFKFIPSVSLTKDVRKIGKLAAPRIIETFFLQISKSAELFFSSLISTSAYTYYTFGNTLQLVPVALFGTSIAKAAFPTLSRESESISTFRKILFSTLYDLCFFVIPIASILVVLRIPIVRLVYGTGIFTWESTVQTGMVLSAFAPSVIFQSVISLLSRGLYALHDTKTPVIVSISSIIGIILLDLLFVSVLKFGVWGLALAFSLGTGFQSVALFYLVNKKIGEHSFIKILSPVLKSAAAAGGSGVIMYFLLKIFDRSVWVKRLSFITLIDGGKNIPFERFVLDTRYSINLLILTIVVSLIGLISYLSFSIFLRSQQVWNFFELCKKVFIRRKISLLPQKEQELISPSPKETS